MTVALEALDQRPFGLDREQKRALLSDGLSRLGAFHADHCPPYRRIVQTVFAGRSGADTLEDLPWLPVRLFKLMELISVDRSTIVKTLVSSGTSNQPVSRIFLDAATAKVQAKSLARIAAEFLGRKRLPMVVIDDQSFQADRTRFNARAAGILGFANLGRSHLYLLDDAFRPDWGRLESYLREHDDTPILLFGFTFMVWQYFLERARADGVTLRFPTDSVLVHGGGWKRLAERSVDNTTFKGALSETFGIDRVHNYYGMVEQVGSIFFECEDGALHAPVFADVLIRDPYSLAVQPNGEAGLIQVLSLLPQSYPGHSLLTEDLGTVLGEDDCACGRLGKRFAVHGRLKNVELRGCSDTRSVSAA